MYVSRLDPDHPHWQARFLGCYQLRSWYSLDKNANYELKLGWDLRSILPSTTLTAA
jgi:hypothetical protein